MKQENFVENIPGILLLSHGPFCQALLESAQMIGGEAVNVVALPLLENASIDEYGEKAMQTFKQMPEGSIVLFDLASGTPFNQMMMKSGGEEFPGLCGMNLPVLLEWRQIPGRSIQNSPGCRILTDDEGKRAV